MYQLFANLLLMYFGRFFKSFFSGKCGQKVGSDLRRLESLRQLQRSTDIALSATWIGNTTQKRRFNARQNKSTMIT